MKAKAEPTNSAFATYDRFDQDTIVNKKYEYAKVLFQQEEYSKSLEVLLPLIDEKELDYITQTRVNLLLAKVLIYGKRDNEKSLDYLRKCIPLISGSKKIDQFVSKEYSILKADIYHHMSVVFVQLRQKDSSNIYLNKIINIDGLSDDLLSIKAKAYANIGAVNIRNKEFDLAKFNLNKAIGIHERLKNNISLASAYSNLATISVLNEDYIGAKKMYFNALTYLNNENSLKAIQQKELLYDNIAWAMYNLKDYKAYEYVTQSYEIRDSLNEDGLNKQYKEIEAKHNVETMQKFEENKRLKLKYNLERKTWIIGGVGVGVSLLFLFLANLYKLRQRNLSLELSQNELRQQRKLERLNSETQVKILNATMDGKETERKQIAEILHDNVSALLSSANMHLQASHKQFGDEIPIELEKTRQIIVEASQKIRDLSHNLVSSILLKFGLEFAIKDAAKKFSNSEIKINAAVGTIHRYAQDYEIKVFNIVQELINNVLKHSQAKNAYIILEEEDAVLNLIVKDDGVGFDQVSEEETGIGLSQIKARIRMMDGQFFIDSTKGKGTKVMVNIPVVPREKVITA
ncbi:ATP-binding protein [Tenacibaculum agarivorans]|uniref:ATP-binding protein n=1 Tax=Tenacibaculum agarivorans TaxID=1908389 RepID=UPI001356538E|nr:ATP-binding protein [Tenacibaculum agarivorans]